MPDSSWQLDGSSIKATVWYKDNGQDKSRESTLDLNRCCRVWNLMSDWFKLSYIPRPDDLSKPNDDYLSGKLTDIYGMVISDKGNGVLRAEHTPKYLIWKSTYTAEFDLKPYIRYAEDGHVEFVHKPYQSDSSLPGWVSSILKVVGDYGESQKKSSGGGPIGKEVFKQLDKLVDLFQEYIKNRGMDEKVKDFLQGTYVDANGDLVRRGS